MVRQSEEVERALRVVNADLLPTFDTTIGITVHALRALYQRVRSIFTRSSRASTRSIPSPLRGGGRGWGGDTYANDSHVIPTQRSPIEGEAEREASAGRRYTLTCIHQIHFNMYHNLDNLTLLGFPGREDAPIITGSRLPGSRAKRRPG